MFLNNPAVGGFDCGDLPSNVNTFCCGLALSSEPRIWLKFGRLRLKFWEMHWNSINLRRWCCCWRLSLLNSLLLPAEGPSNYGNVCCYLTWRNKPILFFLEPFFPHGGRGATSPEQERVVGYIRDLFCSDCTKHLSTHLFFVTIAKKEVSH